MGANLNLGKNSYVTYFVHFQSILIVSVGSV